MEEFKFKPETVKKVLGVVVKEYGQETFISDGYAAHEDIVNGVIEAFSAELKEHLNKCPTVYMVKTEGYRDIWSDKHIPGLDTHECKLFNIKTITEGDNC